MLKNNCLCRLTTLLICLTTLFGSNLIPLFAAAWGGCNDSNGFYDITPCSGRVGIPGGGVSFPVFVDEVSTAGTATISNTATDITIQVDMSQTSFNINKLQVFAAVWQSNCDNIPLNKAGNPKIGQFPFSANFSPGTNSFSFTIPISSICGSASFLQNKSCIHMVIHLDLLDSEGFSHTGFVNGSMSQCWDGSRWGFCLVYPLCCFPPQGTITLSASPNPVIRNAVLTLTTTPPTSGTEPFTYSWYQDNVLLIGTTNTPTLLYTVPFKTSFGIHSYQVFVNGNCGDTTTLHSNSVNVTVTRR